MTDKSTPSDAPTETRLAEARGSTFPTPTDLRTAARVLLWANRQVEQAVDSKPLLSRWWYKLLHENDEEIERKAGLLNALADDMETPNVEADARKGARQ